MKYASSILILFIATVVAVVASLTPQIKPADSAEPAIAVMSAEFQPEYERYGKCDVIIAGQIIPTNGVVLPTTTAYEGKPCTNGMAAIWNSNGVVLIRFSNIGETNWNEKQIAP